MEVRVNSGYAEASVEATKLRVSVAVVNPQASVEATLLQVDVAAVTPMVAVSAAVAAVDVQYILMEVDAFLDVKGLYPLINDAVHQQDQVALGFTTSKTDHIIPSDELLPFLIGKNLVEIQATSEQHSFDIEKHSQDVAATSETTDKDFTTSRADSFVQSDESSNHLLKPFADYRNANDGSNPAETYTEDLTYFASDYVVELIPEFHFYKGLTELLDATDDFFGETNTDDDETMSFTKVLNDVPQVLEALGYSLTTSRADAFATSDSATNALGKAKTDSATSSDSQTSSVDKDRADSVLTISYLTSAYSKPLSDAYLVSESNVYSLIKALSESAIHSDASTLVINKALADSSALSDVKALLTGKALTDAATTSEAQSFDVSKSLSDLVDATDDFLGAANTDDDETMLFATTRSESISSSDSKSLSAGKNTADAASTSESGSIYMTDYCDISYFAGSYVGTYTTF